MELNKQFTITYYSNKDKKHITRQGKWTDKCRYWTSKVGDSLISTFVCPCCSSCNVLFIHVRIISDCELFV